MVPEGVGDSDPDESGTSVDGTALEQLHQEKFGETSSYSNLSRHDSGLFVSDRGPATDMEEEGSTINGSESVLNSSFNSALSGFESLLRKQMTGDEPPQSQASREGNHPRLNGHMEGQERSRSPVTKGHYERIDSGYHGIEYENKRHYDQKYHVPNGDHSNKYSSRNGDDRSLCNDAEVQARSTPIKGRENGWSMSRDSRANSYSTQQGSMTSEQELGRYFDSRDSDRSYDRDRRSKERLPKYDSDRKDDAIRAPSAERVNEYNSHQNYGQKNNSTDSISESSHVKHDIPPRSRSASPYRYNRYREPAQNDNPYRELDPRFRNSSPERPTEPRDRSVSPQRDTRSYSREYHNMPPSPSNVRHQREPPRTSDGSSGSSHQPPMRQPLVTARTVPVSASARPPVNRALFMTNGNAENGHREDVLKVQDLEDTVTTLKRLLRDREHEVDDLKASQRKLESDLHMVRSHSPAPAPPAASPPRSQSPSVRITDYEKKCDELIKEKEVLATEVWKLKKQMSESGRGSSHASNDEDSRTALDLMDEQSGLDNYNPNNQHALRRKISELESQIQDLQEANESADNKLSFTENKTKKLEQLLRDSKAEIDSLYEENKQLRRSETIPPDFQDLEEENSRLRREIAKFKQDMLPSSPSDSSYLRQEIRKLREDLRQLRDENHTLTQDNIKLTEYIRDVDGTGSDNRLNGHENGRLIEPKQAKPSLAVYDKEGLSVSSVTFDEDEFLLCPSSTRNDSTSEINSSSSYYLPSTYSSFRSSSAASSSHGLDWRSHHSSIRDRTTPLYSTEINKDYLRPSAREPSPDRTLTNGVLNTSVVSDLNSSNCSRTSQCSLIEDIMDDHLALPSATRGQSKQKSTLNVPMNTRGSCNSSRSPSSSSSTIGSIKSKLTFQSGVKTTSEPKSSIKSMLSPPDVDAHDQTLVNSIALLEVDETVRRDLLKNLNLTNIEPTVSVETPNTRSIPPRRRRSGSLDSQGSGSTDSILNEAEEQIRMTTSGLDLSDLGLSTDTLVDSTKEATPPRGRTMRSSSPTPVTSAASTHTNPAQAHHGMRSYSASPQRTQHNKAASGPLPKDASFSVRSGRPFVPRSCTEIQIGDVVKFSRLGGKISKGVVKYSGHLPGKNDMYLGLELENEIGKHDGIYDGTRYFTCKHNRGVFVAFSKVVMAWSG